VLKFNVQSSIGTDIRFTEVLSYRTPSPTSGVPRAHPWGDTTCVSRRPTSSWSLSTEVPASEKFLPLKAFLFVGLGSKKSAGLQRFFRPGIMQEWLHNSQLKTIKLK
jgi:hypothetical protein